MDVDEVAGPNDAGVVEIPGFEVERVEGAEAASRLVPAGHIELGAKSRVPGHAFKAIADGRCESPREDVFAGEMPKLNDGLDVVIKAGCLAKEACPKRVPLFNSRTRREVRLLVFETQIVEIRLKAQLR